MLVYMIRHGESEANHLKMHAGWAQVPLTQLGIEQAKKAGEKLKGIAFDRVITSDLKRAIQTCEYALPGCSFEQNPLIREINVGDLSGKNAEECLKIFGEAYTMGLKIQDYTLFNGEKREMLINRVAQFLKQIESDSSETIAVFAHAGVLRVTLEIVLQAPDLRGKLPCRNGCVSVFEYVNGLWRLLGWNI